MGCDGVDCVAHPRLGRNGSSGFRYDLEISGERREIKVSITTHEGMVGWATVGVEVWP
jgi:hypothetical protein